MLLSDNGQPRHKGWCRIGASRLANRIIAPVILFPTVFWAQITVGQEVALFPLHVIAVAQLTWEFGRRGALAGVTLATALWLWGSHAAGWTYSHEWIRFYNAAARGFVYAFAALSILMLRNAIARHRARVDAMRALLDICHGCGAVRGSDDVWVPMARLTQYASERKRMEECPSCALVARH